jgi:WD40 repeat protein
VTPSPPNLAGGPPYVGPRSFVAGQRLYGRERESADLRALLISERVVLLYSPSGAGKTSLLNARVIPELERQQFAVQPVIRVSLGTAEGGGNRYLDSLALSLQPREPGAATPAGLPPGEPLARFLDARPSAAHPGGEVLIFDQFEEILTLDPTDIAAKREFFGQLGAALRNPRRWALFAMREDYVPALDPYLRLLPTRLSCTYRLDLLGRGAAAAAIAGPAAEHGVTVAPPVVERLVHDLSMMKVQRPDGSSAAAEGPYVEPVQLQVVCLRMWEDWLARRAPDAAAIGPEDVGALDSVDDALRDYYDRRVGEVAAAPPAGAAPDELRPAVRERQIREWFDQHLITPAGIRGQVLQGFAQTDGLPNAAIRQLVDAYLVRSERRGGRTWFELAHDRLIDPVRESNAAWLKDNLALAQVQAALWEKQGRPDGLLLRGAELRAANAWSRRADVYVNDLEQAYLAKCRQVARGRRVSAALLGAIVALGLAAGVFGVGALIAQREATARLLTTRSLAAADEQPQRALLLAAAAADSTRPLAPLPEAVAALYGALGPAGGAPLPGDPGPLTAIAVSPDGRFVAAGGNDRAIVLWDRAAPAAPPALLRGHGGIITGLAFGPDGALASTGDDGTLRVWRPADPAAPPIVRPAVAGGLGGLAWGPGGALAVADGATVRVWPAGGGDALTLAGPEQPVNALAWSPDGRRLAGGGGDGLLFVWEPAAGPQPAAALAGHGAPITAVAWGADGRHLASADETGPALLWRADALDAPPQPLGPADAGATRLAFAPDGRALAVAFGPLVELWPLDDPGAAPAELAGHTLPVAALAWSPDGGTLATAGEDGAVRLWDRATGWAATALRAHEGPVRAVAFTPDGASLLSAGDDRQLRRWELPGLAPVPLLRAAGTPVRALFVDGAGRLTAAATDGRVVAWERPGGGPGVELRAAGAELSDSFAPLPGRRALAAATTAGVQLIDLADPAAPPRTLPGGAGEARAVAVSPDGALLAAAPAEGGVLLWRLGIPGEPERLSGADSAARDLAFSPDGRLLAATTGEVAQLWRLDGRAGPVTVAGHTGGVRSVGFSPDSRTLVTGGADGIVRLWGLGGAGAPTPRAALRGHDGPVTALAFSPDGATLASASGDGSVRLWRPGVPDAPPVAIPGMAAAPTALRFTADGRALVTGDGGGLVRVWPLDPALLRDAACAVAGRNLSLDEWQDVFPGAPYGLTCPAAPPSRSLVDAAATLVASGSPDEAWRLADRAAALGGDGVPAAAWRGLCRAGALAGEAARALPACDRAVALDPGEPRAYDSRALARGLAGDLRGAAADLEAYLAGAPAAGEPDDRVALRAGWCDQLLRGASPYDAAALAAIRDEGGE